MQIKRYKENELEEFTRNLGNMLGTGVPLVKALSVISDDDTISDARKKCYKELLRQVRTGKALSEAMKEQPDMFPPLCISMFRSAEESGNVETISEELASYYAREHRIKQKLSNATIYPKILAALIVVVVILIVNVVLPRFEKLFARMDSLPAITRALLAINDFVKNDWYLLLAGIIGIVILIKVGSNVESIKYYFDMLEMKIPFLKKQKRVVYTARFIKAFTSLYTAGIPLVSCLAISRDTVGNTYIERQLDKVITRVMKGDPLGQALMDVDGFAPKLASSIAVGEESGNLTPLLIKLSEKLDAESEIALERTMALIEPVMVIVMGLIVGFIMMAIITPIYGSYKALSNTF